MDVVQIEDRLQELTKSFSKETFIYDFLLAYDLPKASIKRLQTGNMNLSKVEGEILWKKKLFFKEVLQEDLHNSIDELSREARILKHNPRFIVVITSKMHMVWVNLVCGRLKTDYRYSATLCYNTFPFPTISQSQKKTIEEFAYNVLSEREKHSEKTLAQLYDPDKMPAELREAHHQLDLAVERCYRSKPFESDEERLEYLFKLYEKMTAGGKDA